MKKKQKKIDIYKPKLSVFYLELEDYLCAMRETSSFLIKKYQCHLIYELKKTISNSQSIKTIFVVQQLCIF